MSFPSNHLHVMTGSDELTQFWSNSYGLAAENYKVIFSNDFRRRYGLHALNKKIEREIIENKISLLLIEISSPLFNPFIIFDLKQKYDLIIVLIAIDDEFKFDWISSSYATVADLVLTTDYISVNRYRQSGVRAHFVPLPVNVPHVILQQSKDDPKYGVSFVGRVDEGKPGRAKFRKFLAKEIDVSYFGSTGPNDPLFLSTNEMHSIYRNSAINLNFTGITTYLKIDNPLFKRIRGMKLRPFEIVAAGGFCISEFSISVAKCLEDGIDIVFFKNNAELLEKIQYFLSHQNEAKNIAENGKQKIKQQFSAEATANRLTELIKESQEHLGFDLFGDPLWVKVSRWYASSFMVFTLSNSFNLLLKGQFSSFFKDSWSCFCFLRRFSVDVGMRKTLKVSFLVLYKLVKAPRFFNYVV